MSRPRNVRVVVRGTGPNRPELPYEVSAYCFFEHEHEGDGASPEEVESATQTLLAAGYSGVRVSVDKRKGPGSAWK